MTTQSPRTRGILFDIGMFMGTALLLTPITHLARAPQDNAGLLVFLALLSVGLQIAGAWLKRYPFQIRLIEQGLASSGGGCLGNVTWAALFFHLGLFGTLALNLSAINERLIIVALALGVFSTYLSARALTVPDNLSSAPAWRTDPRIEILADGLLFVSAFVAMGLWWVPFVQTQTPTDTLSAMLNTAGYVVALLLFYMGARVLILVEDFMFRWTWLRMALVVLPLALRIAFGG